MSGLAERLAREVAPCNAESITFAAVSSPDGGGPLRIYFSDLNVGPEFGASIQVAVAGAIRAALDTYAAMVDDPHQAHLHYDGCPYQPFAEMPRWEIPDDPPACTCAETHKAAYWKGQFVLERSAGRLAVRMALDEAARLPRGAATRYRAEAATRTGVSSDVAVEIATRIADEFDRIAAAIDNIDLDKWTTTASCLTSRGAAC